MQVVTLVTEFGFNRMYDFSGQLRSEMLLTETLSADNKQVTACHSDEQAQPGNNNQELSLMGPALWCSQ